MTLNPRPPTSELPAFAVLTPPGRGALATVGVRGSCAAEIVGRRFTPASGKPLAVLLPGRIIFGRFRTAAAADEELVVGLIAADQVEIHCHGGAAAVEAICQALTADGCAALSPVRWAKAAEPDPLAAAALFALSQT